MYKDLPILVIVVCSLFFFLCLNLLFCMSVKSLIICIILFYVLFYFHKYLFCCIRTTVSGDYITNPVYYRSNSSLEKNRLLQLHCSWCLSACQVEFSNLGSNSGVSLFFFSICNKSCSFVSTSFAADNSGFILKTSSAHLYT